jgi:hypothetical protein
VFVDLQHISNDGDVSNHSDDEFIEGEEGIIDIGGITTTNESEFPMDALLHIVPFCEGPNEKLEGFVKQKQSAIFAMRHASQLVVHHPLLIYNVPLIIVALLRHIRQTKLCDPLSLRPP